MVALKIEAPIPINNILQTFKLCANYVLTVGEERKKKSNIHKLPHNQMIISQWNTTI